VARVCGYLVVGRQHKVGQRCGLVLVRMRAARLHEPAQHLRYALLVRAKRGCR
jgi:hypothetical protein